MEMTGTTMTRREAKRLAYRSNPANRSARSSRGGSSRGDRSITARDLQPGTPSKRKRATQSGMRSGDGTGRLSDWAKPATLPYMMGAVANDPRWSL